MSVIDGENVITECTYKAGYVQTEFHCTGKKNVFLLVEKSIDL